MVRQLNRRIKRETRREAAYDELIRRDARPGPAGAAYLGPGPAAPRAFDWAEAEADRWIEWLVGSGVDVVGDLEELRPQRPAEGEKWRDPDKVGAKKQLRTALDALAAMTQEAASRPDPERQLVRRVRARPSGCASRDRRSRGHPRRTPCLGVGGSPAGRRHHRVA